MYGFHRRQRRQWSFAGIGRKRQDKDIDQFNLSDESQPLARAQSTRAVGKNKGARTMSSSVFDTNSSDAAEKLAQNGSYTTKRFSYFRNIRSGVSKGCLNEI